MDKPELFRIKRVTSYITDKKGQLKRKRKRIRTLDMSDEPAKTVQ